MMSSPSRYEAPRSAAASRPGCSLLREGSRHSWWRPSQNRRSAVPRHNEINEHRRKICRISELRCHDGGYRPAREPQPGDRALGPRHERDVHGRGGAQFLLTVRDGRLDKVEKGPFAMRSWRFAVRASRESWEKFWQKTPAPGWHDLFALLRRGEVSSRRSTGADGVFALREARPRGTEERMKVEPIVGRYAHIDNCRIYFEEAGRIPLLCLHLPARTAASGARC